VSPKRKTRTKKRTSKRSSKPKKRTSKLKKRVSKCRQSKIGRTMGEFKRSKLKLRNGRIVTNRRQAIAIALSQADRKCK
jgi:hypothetical protein